MANLYLFYLLCPYRCIENFEFNNFKTLKPHFVQICALLADMI